MEDVSSFVIEGGEQDGTRIPMIDDEVLIGWDKSGGRLAWDRSEIGALGLSVFKDWSGIEMEFPNLAVLSYQELAPELNIQPIARISLQPEHDPYTFNQPKDATLMLQTQ